VAWLNWMRDNLILEYYWSKKQSVDELIRCKVKKVENSDQGAVFVFSSIAISYVRFALALNRCNEMTLGIV
jgi:hypothetical protein